jgi:DNA-binding response OmpR family regulator
LLDLVLLRVNGYTVCKSLKETSSTNGVDNYLAKPFSVIQITDISKKYLGEENNG